MRKPVLIAPPDSLIQDCSIKARDDNSYLALKEAYVINIKNLSDCNIDKFKLREWKARETARYGKQ